MATSFEDARRLVLALPGVVEERGAFRLDGKLLAWPWMERVDPRKPRLANLDVLVVRVASEERKRELLAADGDALFTEPHYDGYAAVLVRLGDVDLDRLDALLREAWAARSRPSAPSRRAPRRRRTG